LYNGIIPINTDGQGSEQLGRLAVQDEGGMVNYVLRETSGGREITRATIDQGGNVRYQSHPSKRLREAMEHQIEPVDVVEEVVMGAAIEYLSVMCMPVDFPSVRETDRYLSDLSVNAAHADEKGVLIIETPPASQFAEQLSQATGWRLAKKPSKVETYIPFIDNSNGIHNSSIL
jgi:hypothetical protein